MVTLKSAHSLLNISGIPNALHLPSVALNICLLFIEKISSLVTWEKEEDSVTTTFVFIFPLFFFPFCHYYYYYYYYSFESFSHQRLPMIFPWKLSDSKFLQVSRHLLSILSALCNATARMVTTCPLISMFSSYFTNPLWIIPNATITIGITVTFMFYCFFSSLARLRYSSHFSPFNFP